MTLESLSNPLSTNWTRGSHATGAGAGAVVKSRVSFPVQDAQDISGTLQDAVSLNSSGAETLGTAHQTYARLKAAGESPRAYMEQTLGNLTDGWSQFAKNHSRQSLQVAATLAAEASSVLGPVIMAGFTQGENGVVEVELRRQTSRESLINSSNELSYLTGDHFSNNNVPAGIKGGKVQVDRPLFDETPLGFLLVDTRQGFASVLSQG